MNITALIRAILLHPQFRSTKAKQGLVRSPVEYAVAGMRASGLNCDEANPQWTLESMGQEPFSPPDVSGWKSNSYWISAPGMWGKSQFASSLRWRGVKANNLANSSDLSVADAVSAALEMHGIYEPSAVTVSALRNYVEESRAGSPWAERPGLLYLVPLTPEFQLA